MVADLSHAVPCDQIDAPGACAPSGESQALAQIRARYDWHARALHGSCPRPMLSGVRELFQDTVRRPVGPIQDARGAARLAPPIASTFLPACERIERRRARCVSSTSGGPVREGAAAEYSRRRRVRWRRPSPPNGKRDTSVVDTRQDAADAPCQYHSRRIA